MKVSVDIPVPIPVTTPVPMVKLFVPDHSLYFADREWSGTEIVILSERLQYLVTRGRG
jgi:hypothetical protein